VLSETKEAAHERRLKIRSEMRRAYLGAKIMII
jgi:hypothetical protein